MDVPRGLHGRPCRRGRAIAAPKRSRFLTRQQRKYATPANTYRSGLEEKVAQQLTTAGVPFEFEQLVLPYVVPEKAHRYTPDFTLGSNIVIESKGLFKTEDRQKMILVKAQHPDKDFRLLFSNANGRLTKKSPTTYAKWAEDHGFKWAHRTVPLEWIEEARRQKGATH